MINSLSYSVFGNFTPNSDNGVYYFPNKKLVNTPANRKTASQRMLQCMWGDCIDHWEGSGDTFRLFENYIDLGGIGGNNIPLSFNIFDITYIAIIFNDYCQFYFVDQVQKVSSGIRLYTRPDNWATYICGASITRCQVVRTNLAFRNPMSPRSGRHPIYLTDVKPYDISGTGQVKAEVNNDNFKVSLDDLAIYAVIQYQEFKATTEVSDNIHVFRFDILEFVKKYRPSATSVTAKDFKLALNYIKSIYKYKGTGGSAVVNKIYIYPNTLQLDPDYQGSGSLIQVFPFIGAAPMPSEIDSISGKVINKQSLIYKAQIKNVGGLSSQEPGVTRIRNNIGGEIFFGTEFNGIKLPHFVGYYTTHFNVIVKEAEIQFRVYAGSEIQDITAGFELSFISNTASLNEQEKTSKWLGVLANSIGGVAQIATGGITGAISGSLALANTFNNLPINEGNKYVAGGGGENTFAEVINLEGAIRSFLWFIHFPANDSVDSGYLNFQNNGAITNISFADELATALTTAYLLLMPNPNSPEETDILPYVQASAQIDNVPYQAINDISTALANGVRLKYVNMP